MSSTRQQQESVGAAGSVPGTSSGSMSSSSGGGAGGANSGSSGAQNGNSSANGVSSRTLCSVAEGQSARLGSSSRKRPLYNGLINPYEDKSNDFVW